MVGVYRIKNIAENGKGNFISFDGSPEGLKRFVQPNVIAQNAVEQYQSKKV